jgi:hypothetical protein
MSKAGLTLREVIELAGVPELKSLRAVTNAPFFWSSLLPGAAASCASINTAAEKVLANSVRPLLLIRATALRFSVRASVSASAPTGARVPTALLRIASSASAAAMEFSTAKRSAPLKISVLKFFIITSFSYVSSRYSNSTYITCYYIYRLFFLVFQGIPYRKLEFL